MLRRCVDSADGSDQALIFGWIGPQLWVKGGHEFDGQLWDGSVVTRPYSDWYVGHPRSSHSPRALPESSPLSYPCLPIRVPPMHRAQLWEFHSGLTRRAIQPHSPTGPTQFTLAFTPKTLHIYFGETLHREVHSFGSGEDEEVFVGVMACSPNGEGVKAVFRNMTLSEGARMH